MNEYEVSRFVKTDMSEKYEHVFPIVFAANDTFAPYAGVAIQSVILNANPRNLYRIYVLHTSISSKHVEELERMTGENITVSCISVAHLISGIHTSLPVTRDITVDAYYRILIPELEELRGYPYVIYLDCDVIVNTDIAGIVPENMGNHLIAAVRDYSSIPKIERKMQEKNCNLDAAQYINSGVLVINIPQWNKLKISKKCFDYLERISSKQFVYMDQEIINAVCRDRILLLDDSWNYIWTIRYGDQETVERCKAITDRIGDNFNILHFTTPIKPWCTLDHPYSRYFWKYAGQSPFLEEIIKTNLCSKIEFESCPALLSIARTFTCLSRKMKDVAQCRYQNGTGYTVRRMLYHLGLWENEEAPRGPQNRPKLILRAERLLRPTKDKH